MCLKVWMFWRRSRKKRTIEELGKYHHPLFQHLLDLAALDNCRKGIRQLPHHDLGQIVALATGNIAIAHAVFGDEHIVA